METFCSALYSRRVVSVYAYRRHQRHSARQHTWESRPHARDGSVGE